MKHIFLIPLLLVLVASLCAPAAFGQALGSVKGVCKDAEGKVITGAVVEWSGVETGRKYTLKVNNKGEYFSLGINPGKYNVRLLKDNQELWHINNVVVGLDEVDLDFDLKAEQQKSAQSAGMTAEQVKQVQAQQAQAAKENNTVKSLNEKLAAANTAMQAGDFDTAISTLTAANEIDPARDLIWFRLGDAYRQSATKQTDPAEKQKRFESAAADYQKAIDLRQAATQKDADANAKLAAYYNNLAEVYAKSNKVDDAVKAYAKATELDPAHTSQYMFNTGAVLTNSGKADEAIAAFDKVIAADPNKAAAYYWKGVNLIAKETMDKEGKAIAPPGTAEAFQKYLELEPTGPYADGAKGMLSSIGATIETSYGSKKKTTKK